MTPFSEILKHTDWLRMAEPQDDGYDTATTLEFAENSLSPLRHQLYRRRSTDCVDTFCDNAVAIRPAPDGFVMTEKFLPAPTDHPNLPIAATWLMCWPAAYSQFKALIDTVYPYTDPQQAEFGSESLGSSSHSFEDQFGSLHATVDNALGLAQALIHEMAHQKLRALGVSLERAFRLITNDAEQQFESPIRKDRPRPMTAVFHAQYSFIHVTALNLHMLAEAGDALERQRILRLLARNVPRMEAGFEVIERHIETDAPGQQFVGSFMAWSKKILQQGRLQLIAASGGSLAADGIVE